MDKYNVIVKDINGEVLFEFKDIKPTVKAETFTVTSGYVEKKRLLILECVAQNVVKKDIFPELENDVVEEITNNVINALENSDNAETGETPSENTEGA